MNEKQANFQKALRRFCELTLPDSPVALALSDQHVNLRRNDPPGKPKPGSADWINKTSRWEKLRERKYNEVTKKNGEVMANPSILSYLREAVVIYEMRKDEFCGQTARLFDPANWHIRSIRFLIHLIKDSDYKSPPRSQVYLAAVKIEDVLNEVQRCCYLPKTAKRDGAKLIVDGYSTSISGGGIPACGKAIIVRRYGKGDNERVIIEMTSAALIPHLLEYNAFAGHIAATTDFALIRRDGQVARCNFTCASGDGLMLAFGDRWKGKMGFAYRNKGIDQVITRRQINLIENEIIPDFVRTCPPQVKIASRLVG